MNVKKFNANSKSDAEAETARQELSGLIKAGLGEPVAPRTFDLLLAVQLEFRAQQNTLVSLLDANEITPEAYLKKFNEELQKAMATSREILGADRFEAIFGECGYEPDGLADRETFLATFG